MATTEFTADALRGLVHYNPETGHFTRLVKTRSWRQAGESMGWKTGGGYIQLMVSGVRYRAHRLAFFYQTGAWPAGEIDHIDGNPANNAWANLRDVSPSENQQNRHGPMRNSSHGLLGVTRTRGSSCNPWAAQIKLPGSKRIKLGVFKTAEEAAEAYREAKRRYHPAAIDLNTK